MINSQEAEKTARPDFATLENLRRQHAARTLPPLDDEKQHRDNGEANKGANHVGRVPVFGDAAPLQSKQKADDSSHDDKEAGQIHLQQLLQGRCAAGFFGNGSLGRLEDHDNDCDGHASNRQVDVKAAP